MNRDVPLCFLKILVYWYGSMFVICQWKDAYTFRVTSRVKTGGVLSPRLFAIYLDDLISLLQNTGCCCRIIDSFLAAILYADDMALLAPTTAESGKMS